MTGKDILPLAPTMHELDHFGVDSELVTHTLAGAQSFLEYSDLLDNFPRELEGRSVLVAEYPYSRTLKGQFSSQGTVDSKLRVDFENPDPNVSAHFVGRLNPSDLWSLADKPDVLQGKIARQHELGQEIKDFEDSNPLGPGGIFLSNRFGGIDISDPETTSRHMLVRAAIARKAKLTQVTDFPLAGLLDRKVASLFNDDLQKYFDGIFRISDTLELLPEDTRQTTGAALLEGALTLGRQFIEDHRGRLDLAARIAQDPEFARQALKVVDRP